MSIPKKGSRRINVDGRQYAWLIRKGPTNVQAAFKTPLRVAIQSCAEGARSVLIVNLRVSRSDNWLGQHQTGLTPAAVEDIIKRALSAGWERVHAVSPRGRPLAAGVSQWAGGIAQTLTTPVSVSLSFQSASALASS